MDLSSEPVAKPSRPSGAITSRHHISGSSDSPLLINAEKNDATAQAFRLIAEHLPECVPIKRLPDVLEDVLRIRIQVSCHANRYQLNTVNRKLGIKEVPVHPL